MYLIRKILWIIAFVFQFNFLIAQKINKNIPELGIALAGAEAAYYGIFSKMNFPLNDDNNYFYRGFGLTIYADFRGEIDTQSKLKNDVDMRIIPHAFIPLTKDLA